MKQIHRNAPCLCGSGKKYKECCKNNPHETSSLQKSSNKYIYTYLALAVIFILSIFLRYYGFQQPHGFTFDEGLYSELIAEQLKENPTNYSTQEAYQMQTAQGVKLPEYLNRPLFKHPPLYNYLIAMNYKIFGSSHLSAVSVSIVFGCLMVLIVFLLGKELYDHRVGLLASALLCIDPVHWVCSERIWMETTLSFFVFFAIYLFVRGQRQSFYLLLSGVSIGLAMLTKYPGILALGIIISYGLLFQRSLMRQKGFWLLGIISFIVFLPWIIWNSKVYGGLYGSIISVHGLGDIVQRSWQELLSHGGAIVGLAILGVVLFLFRNKICNFLGNSTPDDQSSIKTKLGKWIYPIIFALSIIFVPVMRGVIFEAFTWKETIVVLWSNPFLDGPWSFYLTRLTELSPFYLYAFTSGVLLLKGNKGDALLILSSSIILVAFIFVGNYQSRYILPAVPFLLLLSARFQMMIYDQLSITTQGVGLTKNSNNMYRGFIKMIFVGINVYFLIKTLLADRILAVGGDFGYF